MSVQNVHHICGQQLDLQNCAIIGGQDPGDKSVKIASWYDTMHEEMRTFNMLLKFIEYRSLIANHGFADSGTIAIKTVSSQMLMLTVS